MDEKMATLSLCLPCLLLCIKIMKNAANWVSREWKCENVGKAKPGETTLSRTREYPVIIRN